MPNCRLAQEGSLFDGQVPEALEEEADFVGRVLSFTAEHMARVDHDTSSGLDETAKVLHEAFGLETHKLNLVTRQKVRSSIALDLNRIRNFVGFMDNLPLF